MKAVCLLSMITMCVTTTMLVHTRHIFISIFWKTVVWFLSTICCDQTARQTSGYVVCTWLKYHEWIRRNKCIHKIHRLFTADGWQTYKTVDTSSHTYRSTAYEIMWKYFIIRLPLPYLIFSIAYTYYTTYYVANNGYQQSLFFSRAVKRN